MRLKYLDVLKAFAIIAVVLYHSGFMPYGYLGVDLFLVINGFLITKGLSRKLPINNNLGGGISPGILAERTNNNVWKEYSDFELSRVVRLLPVLLVAGVACMSLGYFVMLPDDYENLSESVIATNLFGNNILSAITTKNYWDVVNEYKPLMHTWYVGLVMQFYLVYPLLFFLSRLLKEHNKQFFITLISVFAVISLIIYLVTEDTSHRFYYLPSRFFEFAAGGVVALAWKPSEKDIIYSKWFSYLSYALVLVLMALPITWIPSSLKLLLVVALSVVLVASSTSLENPVTGNSVLAKIGAASYSIFVWHQVLLAFYRYTVSSHFTVLSYSLFLLVVALLSTVTFLLIEKKVGLWTKGKRSKALFYASTIAVWVALTGFSAYIYKQGGVVRDVPELSISKGKKADHKIYNDKIYKLDKPFETVKRHWLVVGNSFGRDFANVILESPVADSVEVSYIYINNYKKPEYSDRFAKADRVFLSSLGATREDVVELENVCSANGFDIDKLVIVGTKNLGESNGQIYAKRNRPDYWGLRIKMEEGYLETNANLKAEFGNRYLDLIGLVADDEGTVPVFTPDHHFISQDCRHFSEGGAKWFSSLIDWDLYY